MGEPITTLLVIAVILTNIHIAVLSRRMNRQEDALTTVSLAVAILIKESDEKQNKKQRKKNDKATKKEK